VIAAPIALYAGRGEQLSPAPLPTTTSPAPDVTQTSTPTPEPINVAVKEIPDGFPLAASWPDDSQAESDKYGLVRPTRTLDSLLFSMCDATFEDPDYVDRLRAKWTNPEDYRDRQLTTYADASHAVAAVKALTDFYRGCPTQDSSGGNTLVHQVTRTGVGGDSWALVTYYEFQGAPAIGLDIAHVIRLGRAVLIDTSSGEGSVGDVVTDLVRMTTATVEPVSRMCVFTDAGCADGTDPIPPPAL
jgi:hypothetical protein